MSTRRRLCRRNRIAPLSGRILSARKAAAQSDWAVLNRAG